MAVIRNTTIQTTTANNVPNPNNIHGSLAQAFHSDRLIYRAPEPGLDDEFLFEVNNNSDAAISSSISMPRPGTREAARERIKWLNNETIIGVIVCLNEREESVVRAATENASGSAPYAPSASTTDAAAADNTIAPSSSAPATSGTTVATTTMSSPTRVGVIFLCDPYHKQPQHRQAELGIDIIAPYQGRGYGAEAIRWILDWGFNMAALHRIRLTCLSWNERAARVYRRVGFRLEGTEKESIWCAGRWWDLLWFAVLEEEWREKWKDVRDER